METQIVETTPPSILTEIADSVFQPEVLSVLALHQPELAMAFFLLVIKAETFQKIKLDHSLTQLTGHMLPKNEQDNAAYLATIFGNRLLAVLPMLVATTTTSPEVMTQTHTELNVAPLHHSERGESISVRILARTILSLENPEEALVLVTLLDDPEYFKQQTLLLQTQKEQKMLAKLLKRLNEAMPSLGHQIKQPLSGLSLILDYIQIKLQQAGSDDRTDIRNKISLGKEAITRLALLVDRLLHGESFISTVDLTYCLQKALGSLSSPLSEFQLAGGRFSTTLPDTLPQFKVDEVALTDSIIILLENALKYADPVCGIVAVEAHFDVSRKRLFLQIENNGELIPEDEFNNIFDFGKRSTTEELGKRAKNQDGHGIGLSLLRKNLEDLPEGKVTVRVDRLAERNIFTLSFAVEPVTNH